MSKKYNVQLECPYCHSPIIISYEKYKPFPKSPITDIRLTLEVGCSHFSPGEIKGYAEMGREFLNMLENRRIEYQDLEDKEKNKRLKEILGDFDEDSKYDPSRF